MDMLDRIKAAVNAHEPESGITQWYVDENCIDVDAEEFWTVVAKALEPEPMRSLNIPCLQDGCEYVGLPTSVVSHYLRNHTGDES